VILREGEDARTVPGSGRPFLYIRPEERIPADHPLHKIRKLVREVLKELSHSFGKLYLHEGRASSVFVEAAAADAGLVGDDNDRPPQLIRPGTSQFENSGNELALIRPMDVAAVHIDDAITVEKETASMHASCRVQLRSPTFACLYGRRDRHSPLHNLAGPLIQRPTGGW
jgi:hypothetical protein